MMDIISRFIATSAILLHVLVILRGQNDLVTPQTDSPYIIFGNRVAIHQISLNGSNRIELHQGPDPNSEEVVDIRGLDFDFNRGMMYWSDVAKAVIMQSRLDGSDIKTIVNTGLIAPEDIAWDWVNQKLYWTDRENDTIKVYDPVRNIHKILINTGARSQPRAIIVDPSTRYLYWTDWSDFSPRILKTSMDGANSTVLANGTWVTWPNALAIDYTNQVLYWGDARRDVIGRMNTDGSDIKIIANLMQTLGSNSQPYAMSYYDGHIYWSDWLNGRTILKMDVSPGSTGSILPVVSGVGGSNAHPTGIQVVDASRQSNVLNPCGDNNGGCSHLCLLSPTSNSGFVCVCPDDVPLIINQYGRHCDESDIPATTTSESAAAPATFMTTSSQSNIITDSATESGNFKSPTSVSTAIIIVLAVLLFALLVVSKHSCFLFRYFKKKRTQSDSEFQHTYSVDTKQLRDSPIKDAQNCTRMEKQWKEELKETSCDHTQPTELLGNDSSEDNAPPSTPMQVVDQAERMEELCDPPIANLSNLPVFSVLSSGQTSGYEQIHGYEKIQHYERIQHYEQIQGYEKIQPYEQIQGFEIIQH